MISRIRPLLNSALSVLVVSAMAMGVTGCQLSLNAKTDGFAKVDARPSNPSKKTSSKPKADKGPKKVVVEAGPIWSNDDAQTTCPQTCGDMSWDGEWWTTKWNEMSVCECISG
ncbi:MAG: mannan-binding lectin [Polyangiaceae bacterium]|nr:mannan-binding lectin [Polyangiaceae bacterium]